MIQKNCKVVVSDHALERWNTRVGPHATGEEVEYSIQYIVDNHPDKIMHFPSSSALLVDGEIAAVAELRDSVLLIITFLGRASVNFILSDPDTLLKYKVHEKDGICLKVNESILSSHQMPHTFFKSQYEKQMNDWHFVFWREWQGPYYCCAYHNLEPVVEICGTEREIVPSFYRKMPEESDILKLRFYNQWREFYKSQKKA